MGRGISAEAADAEFRAAGLEPLTPYANLSSEREATCIRCGTWRRVTLRAVRHSVACRWCAGWERWTKFAAVAREQTETWRDARGPDFSAAQIEGLGLVPVTPLGDEFDPVGCLCVRCGETLVVAPFRIHLDRPEWSGCERCAASMRRDVHARAAEVFAAAGLRLLGEVYGRFAPAPVECMGCGQLRRVRYVDSERKSGPACWTCTHGIRPDEPHRVYLFRFPELGVLKIGITHNRHNRRFDEHVVNGGLLLESVVVPDRRSALAVEAWVLATRRAWLRTAVGPEEFPQGGWTEAWAEKEAPPVNLVEICALLSSTSAH